MKIIPTNSKYSLKWRETRNYGNPQVAPATRGLAPIWFGIESACSYCTRLQAQGSISILEVNIAFASRNHPGPTSRGQQKLSRDTYVTLQTKTCSQPRSARPKLSPPAKVRDSVRPGFRDSWKQWSGTESFPARSRIFGESKVSRPGNRSKRSFDFYLEWPRLSRGKLLIASNHTFSPTGVSWRQIRNSKQEPPNHQAYAIASNST